jgi:hypothetical protein
MKLLVVLFTALNLSAALPALADEGQNNSAITASAPSNPDAAWRGGRGPRWHHHRHYRCGPLGLFICGDTSADQQASDEAQ